MTVILIAIVAVLTLEVGHQIGATWSAARERRKKTG